MNKHTATLPDGRTTTRNSKTRTYTHVIAWGDTVARQLAIAEADAARGVDRTERIAELKARPAHEVLDWIVEGWTGTAELAAKREAPANKWGIVTRAFPATLSH